MPRPAPRQFEIEDEAPGLMGGAASALMRRPVDALAGVLAAACTVMILVNALAMQQGRTPAAPAPAATKQSAATPAPGQWRAEPKRDELVAQVQTALAERDLYDGVVDGVMGPGTASAIRAFEHGQGIAQTGEASEKTLAALMTAPMRKEAKAPAARPAAQPTAQAQAAAQPATTGSTTPNPKLMAAQRALAKIGYGPVSIDGKMGAETRNAIKSFERDRNLPETGELGPQVVRALQQMTGAPIQ